MIYTALTGNVDKPREDGIKCFSEYDKFHSPRMNAKIYKVLPHLFMPDEEWWIWHDANIWLKHPEQYYIDLAINNSADTLIIKHPERDCPVEELIECKRAKLDDISVLDKLINEYAVHKKIGLGFCGFLIRRNCESVRRSNEKWWSAICTGTVRDQPSFPFCFPDAVYLPRVDMFNNQYFRRVKHIRKRIPG